MDDLLLQIMSARRGTEAFGALLASNESSNFAL